MHKQTDNIDSTLDKDEQIAYLLSVASTLEQQNKTLLKQNDALLKNNDALVGQRVVLEKENDALIKDNEALSKDLVSLKRDNDHIIAEYNKLVELIKIANARAFGAKSEKIHPHQISLFNDAEAASDKATAEPTEEEVLPRRRKKKTSIDYSKFETVVIEHALPEDDRECEACGATLEEMGTEIKRVIKLVPARLVVEEHRRHVYICKPCSVANATDGQTPVTIVKASMLNLPLEKSCASPSLLAYILHQKYSLALPIYRISDDLHNSLGLTLSRQTLGSWVIRSYERWLAMIYVLMKEKIRELDILHIDETTVQVLKEPKRKPTSKSYMWLFASAACDVPIYIFEYNETRSRKAVADFLDGWSGTVITDGYSAYSNLGSDITRVSCLVHIRRGFAEIVKSMGKDKLESKPNVVSLKALRMIEEIFHIDNTFNNMDAKTKKIARVEQLKPKMDAFYQWCIEKRDEAVPSMALHNALGYAISQWSALENALSDGRLPLENNKAEQAIRPFAVGRKNWLFSDTPRGAEASAAIYSIITTAKGNGLKPREYLTWLFETMPNTDNLEDKTVLAQFLPWSDAIPQSCRIDASETASECDPLNEPVIDVDPTILDDSTVS